MLELLAPAGDMEAFDVAVASGADAVYLGLDNFNARMKAQNFDCDNIAQVVSRAHFYGVKVYVTINTILQNCEFKELIELVKASIDAKVDAFLVQDLGVCKVLKETFDGICLHASTQLGVHNLYGAKVAEKAGFSRVVLSREAKLADIIEIKNNTNLEIEYFVQGALCIAFSGNCYLSSKEQGASGNRGLCKQMCRLPYRAEVQGKSCDGYLLSARDLCLYSSIKQLADAGVCSFKIEGRLRRNGYVACAVQAYRKALDEVEKGNSPTLDSITENELKIAFSRGEFLKRAYLDEGTPKVVEKRFNNHIGIKIGTVKSVKGRTFRDCDCNKISSCKGRRSQIFRRRKRKGKSWNRRAKTVRKRRLLVCHQNKSQARLASQPDCRRETRRKVFASAKIRAYKRVRNRKGR